MEIYLHIKNRCLFMNTNDCINYKNNFFYINDNVKVPGNKLYITESAVGYKANSPVSPHEIANRILPHSENILPKYSERLINLKDRVNSYKTHIKSLVDVHPTKPKSLSIIYLYTPGKMLPHDPHPLLKEISFNDDTCYYSLLDQTQKFSSDQVKEGLKHPFSIEEDPFYEYNEDLESIPEVWQEISILAQKLFQ